MKVKIVIAFLVLTLLMSGVGQAQVIAPPPVSPYSALPMEILTGLIGKYLAMMQQYQLVISQGQNPDSVIKLRIAASIDVSDTGTGENPGLEPLLTEVSRIVFWVNANIFSRYPTTFVVDLSGSFGNIKILTTDIGSIVVASDESVFSILPSDSGQKPVLDIVGIPVDIPSVNELQPLIPDLLPSLASYSMDYEGLRPTPRGMAHVVKLTPIDNDMIITLWVLDKTWDLCKVELFDPKGGITATIIIDQLQLVTSVPDSEFDVDTSAMAELPYESLVEILGLKFASVFISGVPVVADLYPSSPEVRQGEKIEVISDALDVKGKESELVPSMEYKSPDGSWTSLKAEYVGSPPLGSWKAIFAPTLATPPGSYDLKISYTDSLGNTSEPYEFLDAIKVIAVSPNVVKVTPVPKEKQVPTSVSIAVTFNQEMNKDSVESSFSLTDPSGVKVPGSFEWSNASFVFKPQKDLNFSSDYTVKIAGTAKSIYDETLDANLNGSGEGSPKDDFVLTFTTEMFPALVVELKTAGKDVIKGNIVVADVVAQNVSKLGSFTFDVSFNPALLQILKVDQASFANWRPRPKDVGELDVWLPVIINNDKGKATITVSKTRDSGVSGTGVLATITFETIGAGKSGIDLQNASLKNILDEKIDFELRDAELLVVEFGLFDVNNDGVIDILDFVTSRPEGKSDINGDGVVDILDVVASMGPGRDLSLWDTNGDGIVDIQDFIIIQDSKGINPDANGDGVVDILDIVYILGGAKGTPALLVNELGVSFPNPMNPEAWIPFKLAESSDVIIRIYNTKGQLVRTLDLGYRLPGKYITGATAAHWDGKDENAQHVSSGVYFYNNKAGSFTATKKMIVLE